MPRLSLYGGIGVNPSPDYSGVVEQTQVETPSAGGMKTRATSKFLTRGRIFRGDLQFKTLDEFFGETAKAAPLSIPTPEVIETIVKEHAHDLVEQGILDQLVLDVQLIEGVLISQVEALKLLLDQLREQARIALLIHQNNIAIIMAVTNAD